MRQLRGRKRIESAQGQVYDLDRDLRRTQSALLSRIAGATSDDLEPSPRPQKPRRITIPHTTPSWSAASSTTRRVPRYAVEYIVYHEMLHLKHPVKLRGSRRCVHGPAFQAEEKLFPELERAKAFLKQL